jgi:hypothetical protein
MASKLQEIGEWFFEQRTRSLATIFLTRRDDVAVKESSDNEGVDLEVAIHSRKGMVQRKFGVLLRGSKNELTANQANAQLKPTLEAFSSRQFAFPVCLFFFQMVHDTGLYTWVAEPGITDDGSPTLRHHEEASCRELDTDAINEIVESVIAWYEAFSTNVMVGTTARRKKSGVAVLHGIIDGEAAYFAAHGKSPKVLRLPIQQAFELAKLGREHLGDLTGQIVKEGVRVLERDGLLGMKVKLVTDQQDFSLE